jgi:hypothetical protein
VPKCDRHRVGRDGPLAYPAAAWRRPSVGRSVLSAARLPTREFHVSTARSPTLPRSWLSGFVRNNRRDNLVPSLAALGPSYAPCSVPDIRDLAHGRDLMPQSIGSRLYPALQAASPGAGAVAAQDPGSRRP